MAMPETAVQEHNLPSTREYKVWLARQVSRREAEIGSLANVPSAEAPFPGQYHFVLHDSAAGCRLHWFLPTNRPSRDFADYGSLPLSPHTPPKAEAPELRPATVRTWRTVRRRVVYISVELRL